jgi:asparagine synthase (glutamine-hydrolysing)
VGGLETHRVDVGSTTIVWSAHSNFITSVESSPARAAVIWGDAVTGDAPDRVTASKVASEWLAGGPPSVYDGFYGAVVVTADGSIMAGSDVLGFFPIYYATIGETRIVSASPEAIRLHPEFVSRVSLEGLMAVLLSGGPFHGPCLLDGIHRLGAGRVLDWRNGSPPNEVAQYSTPTKQIHASLSFDEQIEVLHHAYDEAIRRHHPPGERAGLLLSGGRDSRLLGACLVRRGIEIDALTMGEPTDFEIPYSIEVAKELGATHRISTTPYDDFLPWAVRTGRWEHQFAGMGPIDTWGYAETTRWMPRLVGNGFSAGRDVGAVPNDFDGWITRITQRSITPGVLRALVKSAEARDIVDGLVERLRADFDANADVGPEEAGFQLHLKTYLRFYIGAVPWRYSFGSTPAMAALDRGMLEAWIGIPLSVQVNRRAIDAVITRWFPRLARMSVDRNANVTHPIAPSWWYRTRHELSYHVPPWLRSSSKESEPIERRRYYRQYDFDNPGWRKIRRAAEPHRGRLAEWFDLEAVNRLLPSPDAPAPVNDLMTQGFDRKALVGFMLWLGEQ